MPEVIVLDTHVWYWWISQDLGRLPAGVVSAIEEADRVGVAAVSCFELALAHRRGRLELPIPISEWMPLALAGSGIEVLALTPEVALRAVHLGEVHRDPFDRIIIATAVTLEATLASVDGNFPAYPELAGRLLGATA